jgi:hypothetical protein
LLHSVSEKRALPNRVAASVLQAQGFRSDVTAFRLNARPRPNIALEPAFRRNEAERVYVIEAAHNPEVAGSNPAPATTRPWKQGLCFSSSERDPNVCKRSCKQPEASPARVDGRGSSLPVR